MQGRNDPAANHVNASFKLCLGLSFSDSKTITSLYHIYATFTSYFVLIQGIEWPAFKLARGLFTQKARVATQAINVWDRQESHP